LFSSLESANTPQRHRCVMSFRAQLSVETVVDARGVCNSSSRTLKVKCCTYELATSYQDYLPDEKPPYSSTSHNWNRMSKLPLVHTEGLTWSQVWPSLRHNVLGPSSQYVEWAAVLWVNALVGQLFQSRITCRAPGGVCRLAWQYTQGRCFGWEPVPKCSSEISLNHQAPFIVTI
jgi:hypothetical protein